MRPLRSQSYVTPSECAEILALGHSLPSERARTVWDEPEMRRGKVAWIHPSSATQWIFDRMEAFGRGYSAASGLEVSGLQTPLQFTAYPPDGEYVWHMDVGGDEVTRVRKITLVVQLSRSADYAGGNFELLGEAPAAWQRSLGTTIAFPAILGHRVTPIVEGIRYALVGWMYGPPYR